MFQSFDGFEAFVVDQLRKCSRRMLESKYDQITVRVQRSKRRCMPAQRQKRYLSERQKKKNFGNTTKVLVSS